MKSDQSQDSADHNKSRGKGKGYVKPDPDADPEEEDKPSKSTYADIAKSILKSSPKISDPPKAAKKPEEKVEIPFYIPDDPEDKEEEAEADLEADNTAMEESVAEEAPEDVQEEGKARAAIQEASAKVSSDILDLLEDPAHIVTSKWLVLMNLPSKITEDGLREILKLLDRSLNLQMKTDKSQVARMKKAMRRSSLLNKAHSVVARQWTMVELPKPLRFRPHATPSDDEGEFAPFALLEKTWVPGADTGGTWAWIDQQDPIAYQVMPEVFAAQVGNFTEIMSYKGAQSDPPALGVANKIALINASLGTIEGLRPGVEYWVAAVPFPTEREYKAGARTRKGVEIILTVLITTNDPDISAAINLEDPLPLYRRAGIWSSATRSTKVICTRLGGWRTVIAASPGDMDVSHLNHLVQDLVTQVVSGLRPNIAVRDVINCLRAIRLDMSQVIAIEVNRGMVSASGSLRPLDKVWLIGRSAPAVVMGLPALTPLLGRVAEADETQTPVNIHLDRSEVGRSLILAHYRGLLDIPPTAAGDPAQVGLTKNNIGSKLKPGQKLMEEGPDGSDFTVATGRRTVVLPEAELEHKLAKFEGRTATQIAAAVSSHGGAIAKVVQEQVVRLVEARFTQERALTTANLREVGTSLYHELSRAHRAKVEDLTYQSQLQGAEITRLTDLLATTTAQADKAFNSASAVGNQVAIIDGAVSALQVAYTASTRDTIAELRADREARDRSQAEMMQAIQFLMAKAVDQTPLSPSGREAPSTPPRPPLPPMPQDPDLASQLDQARLSLRQEYAEERARLQGERDTLLQTAHSQQQDLLARQTQEAAQTVELARQAAELEALRFAKHQESIRQQAEVHSLEQERARQVQAAALHEEEKQGLLHHQSVLQAKIEELAAVHQQGEAYHRSHQAAADAETASRQQRLQATHEAEQRAMAEAQHRQQLGVLEQEQGLEQAACARDAALQQEALLRAHQQDQYLQEQAQAQAIRPSAPQSPRGRGAGGGHPPPSPGRAKSTAHGAAFFTEQLGQGSPAPSRGHGTPPSI